MCRDSVLAVKVNIRLLLKVDAIQLAMVSELLTAE